jgi:hypothetical protein
MVPSAASETRSPLLPKSRNRIGISFFVKLGVVLMSNTKFDVVGADVPVTGSGGAKLPDKPVNLDFTE